VEYHAAQLGIDPEGKELWELACAFGAHRVEGPPGFGAVDSGAAPPAGSPFIGDRAHDTALAQMIADAERARETADRPEWSEPTEAEVLALRPLLRH
jgi:hypothetical protein